jgi:hypothetical protein
MLGPHRQKWTSHTRKREGPTIVGGYSSWLPQCSLQVEKLTKCPKSLFTPGPALIVVRTWRWPLLMSLHKSSHECLRSSLIMFHAHAFRGSSGPPGQASETLSPQFANSGEKVSSSKHCIALTTKRLACAKYLFVPSIQSYSSYS